MDVLAKGTQRNNGRYMESYDDEDRSYFNESGNQGLLSRLPKRNQILDESLID